MSKHPLKHVDQCLNCGAATPGAYCGSCGQEAVNADVRFRDQAAHFVEEVLSIESRLPQTLSLLFTSPGGLTKAYNSGQRVKFITPLKLYLFASVVFFFILAAVPQKRHAQVVKIGSGDDIELNVTFDPKPPEVPVGPEDFDRWVSTSKEASQIPPFLRPHIRALLGSPEGFLSALIESASKASLVLVPVYALFLRLLYWRPRRFYGEHLVFSLHVHSFAYVLGAAASLIGIVARLLHGQGIYGALGLVGPAYLVFAARRAYSEGVLLSAVKMFVAGIAYLVGLVFALLLAAAAAFFAI